MTIDELLNLDIGDVSKLNRQELAKVVSKLGSASNKRVKRFNEKGVETPATRGLQRSGGNISVKGKTANQLRAEYVRAKTFLTAKTSTSKGFKKIKKDFETRIGGALSPEETKTFWSAYNKLYELEPGFLRLYGSDRMQQYLRDEVINGNNSDDLATAGRNRLQESYEQIEREYVEKEDGYNGTSDFFELGEDL